MFFKIGIVGATGLVGLQLLKILSENNLNIDEVRLFSSEKSINCGMQYKHKKLFVKPLYDNSFLGLDYVFFCSINEISERFSPLAIDAGAKVIDNSSHFRMSNDVPLVIPEINWDNGLQSKQIFANPNCSTIIALTALYPLHKAFNLKGFHATTFQSASGYGGDGLTALQTNNTIKQQIIFGDTLSLNVIPKIGDINEFGYTTEEGKMSSESKKILNNKELKISATCVRVPVERAHSISMIATFENDPELGFAKNILKQQNNDYICYSDVPTPLFSQNKNACFVGRLRQDTFLKNSLSMFISCDQILKGAALNAVQIFKKLTKQNFTHIESSKGINKSDT